MRSQNGLVRYVRLPLDVFLKIIRMNKKTKTGMTMILALGVIALIEPAINNYRLGGRPPNMLGLFRKNLHSSLEIPLGTDVYGRDIFGMMLMGLKFTLAIGLFAATIEIIIAISLGFLAGYKGGLIDHTLRSVTDFIMVIPTWPILVLISAFIPRIDLIALGLVIAALGWPSVTRALRSQVLSLKERPYVELAKVSGLRDIEIIFKEILPNILPYVGVGFASGALSAMFAESGIRLFGFGPPGLPTLGYVIFFLMTGAGAGVITTRPYTLLSPILLLIMAFISLNLINVGLDEAYNPRLKKITGM